MNKVLFLNLYDDPAAGGGAEAAIHHLTQGLISHGVEPVLLATAAERGLRKTIRDGVRIWRAGVRNLYWPDPKKRPHAARRILWHAVDSYNLAMQPVLRRVLEIERPDVVSIHNLPGWSAAAWATIADKGVPAVQVLHDSYAVCPKATMYKEGGNCGSQCAGCRLLRLPHRRLSNRISAVVGVSRFILDRHLEQGYFGNVSIQRVIHDARDAEELGVAERVARNDTEALRVGFIGRLDSTKGIESLLEGFLAAAIPNAELWIAGSGKTAYEECLRARYASGSVHFLGWVEPRTFYPRVDVVVVPSAWHEPLGMVVAEALAFGKPVIASRRGGIPEMIRDNANGLLFEPNVDGELAMALQRLACDPALKIRMSEAARASARPFLDRNDWVARYLHLYSEIGGMTLQKSSAPQRSDCSSYSRGTASGKE